MNIERGAVNTLLVPGREMSDSYILRFTYALDKRIAECTTSNTGNAKGPLLLAFEEKDTPIDADELKLIEGDHLLQVLIALEGGDGDFNEDFSDDFLITEGDTTYRQVWSEQVRVN